MEISYTASARGRESGRPAPSSARDRTPDSLSGLDRDKEGCRLMGTHTLTIEDSSSLPPVLYVEDGSRYTLGRAGDADFSLPPEDPRISRYHAAVEGTLGGIRIQDLGSGNGTFVNGARVDAAMLRPGDRVRLGNTVLAVDRVSSLLPPPPRSYRPAHEDQSIETTRFDTLRGEAGASKLVCASCGADWPGGGDEDDGDPCPTCHPRRPLGDGERRTIGPFDLLGIVGETRGSKVYEARHRTTGKRCAMKRISLRPDAGAEQAARIARAQRTAMSLNHPGLVRTFSWVWSKEASELCVSMEWLPGGNCRKLALPTSPLGPMLMLAADLFDALAYLHAMGLVHGRVKPDNVLLARLHLSRWSAKLGDFGGRLPGRGRETWRPGAPGDHATTDPLAFTAPELLLPDRAPSPATDIYSAATTVSFLLTGSVPFTTEPGQAVAEATCAPRRVSLSERRPDAPADLVSLLDNAVLTSPSARTSMFAGEIAVRIRRIAENLPS